MKRNKYLSLYKKYMESGNLSGWGLCCDNSISPRMIQLFEPTLADVETLVKENLDTTFWGSGLPAFHADRFNTFTPLRQTLVLFMAAVNKEF